MSNPALYTNEEDLKKKLQYCGENVKLFCPIIFPFASESILLDSVRIDAFTSITCVLQTKSFVQIMSGARLTGGRNGFIDLDYWTFIGYNSQIHTSSEDYSGDYGPVNLDFNPGNKTKTAHVVFEKYSGIASNTLVMPGVTLPEGCTIGANSFVYSDKDLLPYSIFLGNPLKFHKHRNEEIIKQVSYNIIKDQ
jgi:galactoside O-acetyltransferase